MAVVARREQSPFWRKVSSYRRGARQPVPPPLPLGAVVRVPERGDVFFRYMAGPPGAPTVLLLHGFMVTADINWLGAFRTLAGSYHVLAVDHRGHGRGIRTTERFTLEDCADDAAGLLHALGVRDAVVAGYSMGGPIGLLLARRHPGRVRGLVLVATSAQFGRSGLERVAGVGAQVLGPFVFAGLSNPVLRWMARTEPAALGASAELSPWLAAEMKRMHPADVMSVGRAITGFDGRAWVGTLNKPTVSVITTRDVSVRPDRQRATAALMNASIVELDAGHGVCTTEPAALGAAVRQAVGVLADAGRVSWFNRARKDAATPVAS
jgi:3-oxoadipate enol-lactonase